MSIKLENVVLTSPEQMEFIIEGMRNPMNSWEKSDSGYSNLCEKFITGDRDVQLMQRLSNAGTEHRKYMRMMPVYVRITAPLYWWKEFDTYKIGTVANSCSTMHKIAEKEFTMEDFSTEYLSYPSLKNLKNTVKCMNDYREEYLKDKEKHNWWQMIQLLPSSYNQTDSGIAISWMNGESSVDGLRVFRIPN